MDIVFVKQLDNVMEWSRSDAMEAIENQQPTDEVARAND
jgi:hypothetical protein